MQLLFLFKIKFHQMYTFVLLIIILQRLPLDIVDRTIFIRKKKREHDEKNTYVTCSCVLVSFFSLYHLPQRCRYFCQAMSSKQRLNTKENFVFEEKFNQKTN
jgi:hypothetical protein